MTHAGETATAEAPVVAPTGRRARKATSKPKTMADEPPTTTPRRSRRRPWLLGLAIAAAGAVLVIRRRQTRPTEPILVTNDEHDHMTGNGSAPMPRQEQPNGQLNRQN